MQNQLLVSQLADVQFLKIVVCKTEKLLTSDSILLEAFTVAGNGVIQPYEVH